MLSVINRLWWERFGEEAPLKLMDLYADGVREREAMPSVLGIERDEFIRDFTAWAWEDAATWGMATRPRRSSAGFAATGTSRAEVGSAARGG